MGNWSDTGANEHNSAALELGRNFPLCLTGILGSFSTVQLNEKGILTSLSLQAWNKGNNLIYSIPSCSFSCLRRIFCWFVLLKVPKACLLSPSSLDLKINICKWKYIYTHKYLIPHCLLQSLIFNEPFSIIFCLMNFHTSRVLFYSSGISTGILGVIPRAELFTLMTENILTRDKTEITLLLLFN